MSPKRGDDVAPPPLPGEYRVRFDTNDAAKGWDDLCRQAPGNTYAAWVLMRTDPCPAVQTPRHAQLKHKLAAVERKGEVLPQWQIEVTGGGRIWYLLDESRTTCWVRWAGTGHPKATD